MTTNQDVLKALTALAGHVRDDIREEIRQLRAHLHERFDRVDAHFDRLGRGARRIETDP
jgi:uncharacterized protein YicC (UPF0701 family)